MAVNINLVRPACYACENRFRPRNMVRIFGEEHEEMRQIALGRRDNLEFAPREVDEDTRICFNCSQSILREIRLTNANPLSLRLNVLKQTRNNSCFLCNRVDDIHRLSMECKVNVFVKCNIYFPETVRSCNVHLDQFGNILDPFLEMLRFVNKQCVIPGRYLQSFLQGMRDYTIKNRRFNDIDDLTEEETCKFTSLTKIQFDELFTYLDRVPNRRIIRKDLLMFLTKMRQGLSDEFLCILFRYQDRRAVSYAVAAVRQSLMIRFVPENMGMNAITRDQYIREHVTEFSNALYNPDNNRPVAIAYIDGTYTYSHKSTNFRALRQTFCRHKGKHLIKPALVVAPDGYILDIHGPYFSDAQNNDAAMFRKEWENNENFRNWFQRGDIFILDRGYRDAVNVLENSGMVCRMPPSMRIGQRQLSTEDANEARIVTKTRWIVEARNGHLKSIFRYLGNIQQIHVLPNIGDFYRIGAALINRYHPLIYMENANAETARVMLQRSLQINDLQNRVLIENLANRNAERWVRLDANLLEDFPELTIEFLKDLTVGVFQIKLAPSYIQDTFQREQSEEIQIDMLRDQNQIPEPGFLRARVWSRYRNAAKYWLFIEFAPNPGPNQAPIGRYYCTCKTGARTLGTCVHVSSMLWYLGHARWQPAVKYPSHQLIYAIDDAGERPEPENPPQVA